MEVRTFMYESWKSSWQRNASFGQTRCAEAMHGNGPAELIQVNSWQYLSQIINETKTECLKRFEKIRKL